MSSLRSHPDLSEILIGDKKLEAPFSSLLVFPNTHEIGMCNLGFLSVARLIDQVPHWYTERAFLGDRLSREKKRTFSSFDLIAFSVSYEPDFLNISRSLDHGGIPTLASERGREYPLVIAGGAAVSLNPEPLAELVDVILLGEAEGLIDEFLIRIQEGVDQKKAVLLKQLSEIPGVYVPSLWAPQAAPGPRPGNCPPPASQPWLGIGGARYICPESVFANRGLVEVGRGCSRGCRFCAAGFIYRPVRYRPLDEILKEARLYHQFTDRIGLLSPAVSDHPQAVRMISTLVKEGFKVSVSSLRAETASADLLQALAQGGQKEITLAPEAGSERMRRRINKNIDPSCLKKVLRDARQAGMRKAKLYFLVGLPGETEEDLQSIVGLCSELAAILPLRVGLSPLVPKPATPFQHLGLAEPALLKKKMRGLSRQLRRLRGVEVSLGSVREALLQAVLSRGGRDILRIIKEKGVKAAVDLVEPCQAREDMPFWSPGPVSPEYLAREWEKAQALETTAPCPPSGCHACGACPN